MPVWGNLGRHCLLHADRPEMRIFVETAMTEDGFDLPRSIRFGDRHLDVAQTIDQWHGADHRYLKVIGVDGHTYILRHDEVRDDWDLTLFQRR